MKRPAWLTWPLHITFPHVFGWNDLTFPDRLKLMGFLAQLGAGIAMTAVAFFALFRLAEMKATWPVFYLGAMSLVLVGIVVTGFAGLLIARTLEVRGPGGFVLKSQDADMARTAIAQAGQMPPPPPAPIIVPVPTPPAPQHPPEI